MEKPPLIRLIEDRFGRKPPKEPTCRSTRDRYFKPVDGCSVVIIGGGMAGTAFAKRILTSAVELGIRINTTIISRPSCNYCGGLITNLALRTMRGLYGYEPAPEVVLSEIDEAILVNSHSSRSVRFESPLASVFRTSRFGQVGLDDNFRENVLAGLPKGAERMLSVIQPAVATSIELPQEGKRGSVTFLRSGGMEQAEADLIVLATGLRSLQSKFISSFRELTGYQPPAIMPACVTEVEVSTSETNEIGRRMLILNGVVPDTVVALIPKQLNWITIAALNKVLDAGDLRAIFAHPMVRNYVRIDSPEPHLPCNRVCTSGVFVGSARKFYGDGWVVVGDLTGYGRVLKDGYFAALLGADLAAHTAIEHGCSEEAFALHYHPGLRHFETDNRVGMGLFTLNNFLARSGAFNRAIIDVLEVESAHQPYGGLAHAAFRALSTGELSYRWITLLFIGGLTSWAVKDPVRAFKVWRNSHH